MAAAPSVGTGSAEHGRAGVKSGGGRTIDEVLDVLMRDAASHVTGAAASEQDLRRLEKALRQPLPPSLRALLSRCGGGLFYEGHEIFGPHPVVIHDIELVPSLASMLGRLRSERAIPEGLVPVHRAGSLMHLLDMRDATDPERVVSLPHGSTYPDLAAFLETVVLPPGTVAEV